MLGANLPYFLLRDGEVDSLHCSFIYKTHLLFIKVNDDDYQHDGDDNDNHDDDDANS